MKLKMLSGVIGMVLVLFVTTPIYSQQYEIAASGGLEIPLGNMTWTYGPSVSYNLSFLKVKNTWKPLKGAFGVNLGYAKFDSGDKVLEYEGEFTSRGVAQFSDYTLIMLSANCGWKYELNDLLEASFGWDMGYYYSRYEFSSKDDLYGITNSTTIEGRFAFSPRVGVAIAITDELAVIAQTRYNICLRVSDPATGATNNGGYNSASSGNEEYSGQGSFGIVNYIWSNTFGVQYRFGR